MRVSSKPNLTLKMILERSGGISCQEFPFNTSRCQYYYSARYALTAAIKALRLSACQRVLLPAYNCWVEIDPFVRQGIPVDWYRVNKDFSIDVEDITRRIRPETAAIMVIHYLGFPQRLTEIQRICTERGLALIEDCAHALLSDDNGVPLGSTGDLAIFSLRKTLPLPDGGCLLINNPALTYERPEVIQPNRFATYFVISEMLAGGSTTGSNAVERSAYSLNLALIRFIRGGLRGGHKIINDRGDYLIYPSGNSIKDQVKGWGMSKVSATIINGTDFSAIKERRRANFLYLLENIQTNDYCTLPISSLPEGVCPLFFPVIVQDRDRIYYNLKIKGLSGHNWWGDYHPAVPWDDFPEAVFLKKDVFGFPVHQDVTVNLLDKMLHAFTNIL